MGYLGNHLATVVTGVFAAILTVLWPIFVDFSPVIEFVFIMAVPIMWFLVFTCWIAQKSADYMHSKQHSHPAAQHNSQEHITTTTSSTVYMQDEKKSLNSDTTTSKAQNDTSDIQRVQNELLADVDELKESLKLKDSEIDRLNRQIINLQTRVQIETIKAELANLKMLASKQKK